MAREDMREREREREKRRAAFQGEAMRCDFSWCQLIFFCLLVARQLQGTPVSAALLTTTATSVSSQ